MTNSTRRSFLGGLAPAVLTGKAGALPEPGATFNESVPERDPSTGRHRRRLTSGRRFNQQPTYHLNACFTRDSRALLLTTEWEDGRSAILHANVETGALTVVATTESMRPAPQPGWKFNGNNLSVAQAAGFVAAKIGRSVRLYDLSTFRERVLIEDAGEPFSFGHPVGSVDGSKIYVPRMSNPPEPEKNGNPATHLEIDVTSGVIRELFHESLCSCNHVVPCPSDPDLLLIDRDMPPKFGRGGDGGRTTRVWILSISSGKLREVRPRDTLRIARHSNWNWKGDRIYYHGPSVTRGEFIGVADACGRVLWEHIVPEYIYGHMSSHTCRNAMITDGIFTRDMISAVYFEERDSSDAPRIEVLGRHATDWDGKYGQFSHPHCHVSPDGNWLSFNRGAHGRSDVYVLRLT